ncbi:tRNA (guanosine(37)-N1)-methyltransferase TrmD [Campylobacter sp. CNRCH_2016_3089]|uniref:tRNA (guanosine(37)-N1)-methyltransferase TrmD n=1 Tax=unclassified Campylobacter TaxID=2593542 RepID=UPI0012709A40|nr:MULTISPECIES: tRNA (guanosine(37)-N1)-methyltransferase TrmD [unclassified Campylobacter]EAJ5677380.1 tRNA (guanosine(37)-N1)-methyltransferase TrmD [Campylobacter lari]EAK0443914.1 tRNA (guanosine(37)-N1)-methyltransferase TrmD [Campylobacter lari]EAK9942505.1 tRNA (guanosine(37)-N1)-methyltransferase TrmD [Campylobacter lari]EGK8088634.1 tRNA (guanosine(37)-N1)-methyltransferase TrmD [Campylobacter lari]MCV3473152.1 tRNA (guanosine(37)-N1)-methyltransferase TrmD [Campylobacter sp. CNRCH_2
MKYTFVSLFPELIEPYFKASILARAKEKGILEFDFVNPRNFTTNKHLKVDDYKIGGGAGLLLQAQPLYDCLTHIKSQDKNTHFIFLLPCAKTFKQIDAKRLSVKEHICFVCSRYEGLDERIVEEFANEVFSIGDFILTGGELASLVMCDAISRNIQDVLGNSESLSEESFENDLLEAPSFSKPFVFEKENKKFYVPSEFLKGNHAKITALKTTLASCKTKYFRPDLYQKHERKF